jgi:hypothetical protein
MHLFVPNLLLALRLMHRARLSVVVVALAVTLVLVAWLAGQFSPRQPATVALDVGISFIRLALPVLVLLQIQDLVEYAGGFFAGALRRRAMRCLRHPGIAQRSSGLGGGVDRQGLSSKHRSGARLALSCQ